MVGVWDAGAVCNLVARLGCGWPRLGCSSYTMVVDSKGASGCCPKGEGSARRRPAPVNVDADIGPNTNNSVTSEYRPYWYQQSAPNSSSVNETAFPTPPPSALLVTQSTGHPLKPHPKIIIIIIVMAITKFQTSYTINCDHDIITFFVLSHELLF